MVYIGVDPGWSGGIAWIDGLKVECVAMPDTPQDMFDLLSRIRNKGECRAILERVNAMPKQGVSSTFKFGQQFGMCEMALAGNKIPYKLVTPAVWQRGVNCLSKGDKKVTRKYAQQLFPDQKVTHAVADALLIMTYCIDNWGN